MKYKLFVTPLSGLLSLLAVLGLFFSVSAQATAPRISASMFGEQKKVDIVGYQLVVPGKSADVKDSLALDIVQAAFAASGKSPVIDILPSKQIAQYSLTSNEVGVLMGSPQDLQSKDKSKFHTVIFYLGDVAQKEQPVALIFNKAQAKALYQGFNAGLHVIIKNGEYIKLLEKQRGNGKVPADYMHRLKLLNPGWE